VLKGAQNGMEKWRSLKSKVFGVASGYERAVMPYHMKR